MAEEGCQSRFVCKLCNKKCPCEKSLGGHMRSHVVANSAEFKEKVESSTKNISFSVDGEQQSIMKESKFGESGNGQSGYCLRENPKKTWRAVDSRLPLPQDKVCKQCGKGFQSLKALCGHMACHSEKDKSMKDDHSWTGENKKLVFHSQSDRGTEERRLRTRSSKSKRYKKIADDSPFALANNGSLSVSEIDGQDVAMCLMLLSRDSGNKAGVNSVVESSDNNSVVMETKSSSIGTKMFRKESINNISNRDGTLADETAKVDYSDSGYFLDECAKAESNVSVDWFRRYGGSVCKNPHSSVEGRGEEYGAEVKRSLKIIKSFRTELSKSSKENEKDLQVLSEFAGVESKNKKYSSEHPESWNESTRMIKSGAANVDMCNSSQKKSKYECFNCKKTFKSYQALGGHRPCHNRSNGSYESRDESGENNLDKSTHYTTKGKLVESSNNRKLITKNSSRCNEKKSKSKKSKGHVCPFCNRVFKNGQALGGHKRSHFISGHDENNRSPEVKPERPDLLDLNLPAPEADEDDGQFYSR